MFSNKKPIKGFSLYGTDGTGVYLRDRLLRPVGEQYNLIPDGGDGVNLKAISVEDALSGGVKDDKIERRPSTKASTKRRKKSS